MSILKQKKQLILVILIIAVLTLPYLASARGLVPCGGYNADGSREPQCTIEHAFFMIARVTNWLVAMAGLYTVYKIVNAGFFLIITMGNEEKITTYKKALSNAVVGFALVMMAFMFMNTVVNLLLAQGEKCKTISFASPLTYVTMDPKDCMSK